MKKKTKIILLILGLLLIIGILTPFIINSHVKNSTKKQIVEVEKTDDGAEAILILGAGLKKDNTPSDMLEDRLITGFNVYEETQLPIIVSGDHGQRKYDEVNAMKKYLIGLGVPSEDIFMDHAGFSTYESVFRARDIFRIKKVIIITQKYHLYRALYIANLLDLDAVGVSADIRKFAGQPKYDLREFLARNKDFVKTIFKPNPTYLGDAIPVTGDGNITND